MAAVVAEDLFGRNPSSSRVSPNYPKIPKNLELNGGFLGARAPGCVPGLKAAKMHAAESVETCVSTCLVVRLSSTQPPSAVVIASA